MVINDYDMTMTKKPLGVAEFKAKLSEYLRAVKKGHVLIIADRDQPIARVVPYAATSGQLAVREPLHNHRTLGDIPMPPPAKLPIDPVTLLLEDRQRER
jgi:prevent-host-death family protein